MASTRIVLGCASLALGLTVGLAGAQDVRSDVGPIESRARPITPENPVPRRFYSIAPLYPAEAAIYDITARVTLRLTLDEFGRVAEIRRMASPAARAPVGTQVSAADLELAGEALIRSAAEAFRQWQYDPPADGPISFNVTVSFSPDAEPALTSQDTLVIRPPAPPPPPPPPVGGRPGEIAAGPPGPAPVRVGGNIRAPVQVKRVPPLYPPAALAEGVKGVVILEAVIGADGRVTDVRVLRSIPLLNQAAIDAVRQWEYQPTLMNGVPVAVIMTVTVVFTLP
jgi:protein TonB